MKGAAIGAVTAALTFGVAHGAVGGDSIFSSATGANNAGDWIATKMAEGVIGGAASEVGGGDFKDGLIGSVAGSISGAITGNVEGAGPTGIALRTAVAATIGGTAAEVTGGDFANGAFSAAFTHLFNEEVAAVQRMQELRDRIKNSSPYGQVMLSENDMQAILYQADVQARGIGFDTMSTKDFLGYIAGFDGEMFTSYRDRYFIYNGARYAGSDINYISQGMAWAYFLKRDSVSSMLGVQLTVQFNVGWNLASIPYGLITQKGYSWGGIQRDLAQATWSGNYFSLTGYNYVRNGGR